MLLVFVLLGIHDWCVFEALFNLVAANLKAVKLNVDSSTIWLSDISGHLINGAGFFGHKLSNCVL